MSTGTGIIFAAMALNIAGTVRHHRVEGVSKRTVSCGARPDAIQCARRQDGGHAYSSGVSPDRRPSAGAEGDRRAATRPRLSAGRVRCDEHGRLPVGNAGVDRLRYQPLAGALFPQVHRKVIMCLKVFMRAIQTPLHARFLWSDQYHGLSSASCRRRLA